MITLSRETEGAAERSVRAIASVPSAIANGIALAASHRHRRRGGVRAMSTVRVQRIPCQARQPQIFGDFAGSVGVPSENWDRAFRSLGQRDRR
jgi:hypothetical protein